MRLWGDVLFCANNGIICAFVFHRGSELLGSSIQAITAGMKDFRSYWKWRLPVVLVGVAVGLSSCGEEPAEPTTGGKGKKISADEAYRKMIRTEEVVAELVEPVNRLKKALANLEIVPDARLFAEGAQVVELAQVQETEGELPGVQVGEFGRGKEVELGKDLEIWSSLFDRVTGFKNVGLGTLKGEFGKEGGFYSKLKVSLGGITKEGKTGSWKGKIGVDWIKEGDDWLISRMEPLELRERIIATPLFGEVLDRVLTSPEDLQKARQSVHERYIREVFFTGETKFAYPRHYWNYIATWDSLDQHTSVAVVDVDDDGRDDFYVTARWGRNQLWRNRGDGTFEDIASRVGLDLDGVCNCSLFADFDNDGDKDVLIGRSLERARYFMNVDGVFHDRTEEKVEGLLPYWTSAISSADVNGDGLLDLYLATYRLPISRPRNVLAKEFLSPAEQEEWKRRRVEDHPVFRLTGPPNLLLINQGDGRFVPAPKAGGADLWLSSFQGTWSDYDNDGDPDLFVANDYAPDHVFRNDGGRLVDVTREVAGDQLQGFGMGVTLGDFDNDGWLDPYFTYMYSKAGNRITSMFQGLERRMYEGVKGNKLLRNTGSGFEPVDHQVAQAGWSWGGQFADFDNDGFLDLYVANGLYTPPPGTQTEVDL